ncbi:MAG: hypothetical protein ACFFCQ_13650, partial [Promethearchaeota archaeon]
MSYRSIRALDIPTKHTFHPFLLLLLITPPLFLFSSPIEINTISAVDQQYFNSSTEQTESLAGSVVSTLSPTKVLVLFKSKSIMESTLQAYSENNGIKVLYKYSIIPVALCAVSYDMLTILKQDVGILKIEKNS